MHVEDYSLAQVHEAILSHRTLTEVAGQLKVPRTTLRKRLRQRHHDNEPLTFERLKGMTTQELLAHYPDDHDKPLVAIRASKKRLHATSVSVGETFYTSQKRHQHDLQAHGLFSTIPTPTPPDHKKSCHPAGRASVMVHLQLPYPMMFTPPKTKSPRENITAIGKTEKTSAFTGDLFDRHAMRPLNRKTSATISSSGIADGSALPVEEGPMIDITDPAWVDYIASIPETDFNDILKSARYSR